MKTINKIICILLLGVISVFVAPPTYAAPPENFQVSQIVGTGLNGPSGFEIAPDGRIFILERTGKIKIVSDGILLSQPFADLPSVASGDRGLIGIAFDPSFGVTNHYVYFYYTGTDFLNRLVRFDASTNVGTNGPFLIYQTTSPSQELHVGGSIRFGPDGKLYFAVGDNGYPPNAQNLGNPHGKILRINKDGSIPADNPFVGQANTLPEIWAYGMRNPWRFQFDSDTGRLYGGDVGDYTWEEVNQIKKGENYGWPMYEGNCQNNCGDFVNPIYAYNHDGESAAVTGGPIYRGTMFPAEYQGSLFFGDYAKGFIKRIALDEYGNATNIYDFDLNAGSVVDLKIATDGSLYYITYYPGRLYKISYTTGNHAPTANATADNLKGIDPHTVNFSSEGSLDPDNDPISFLWKFGDGTTSYDPNPTKIYSNIGTYTVELSVSDGENISNAIPIVIQVGIPPTVNIGEPAPGEIYVAGNIIHYTASALDGAGFDLDDRNISTEILLHHDTHIHPFLGPIIGRQGTFIIPVHGEASSSTWFEIKVTATDTNGLSTTKSVFIYPQKSDLTFSTSISGLKILIDGVPYLAEHTLNGVVGFIREISVQVVQELNGKYYQFVRWSDNGLAKHFITTPEANTTYTATFEETVPYDVEYFDNPNLSGNPVLVRQESKIDYLWGEGSPDVIVPTDNFSVRWTKDQYFAQGRYKFITATDDGVRLFVDDQLVINEWHSNSNSFNTNVDLLSGVHEIRMEYFEGSGLANAKLDYELAQDQPAPIGFTGQYYSNKELAGTPQIVRIDPQIDFTWGNGSPDSSILPDNYSVRWTKSEDLSSGIYEFEVTADDGVRLFVDGELILDKWIDQPETNFAVTKNLNSGIHTITMEYYEFGGSSVSKLNYQKISELPIINGYSAEYFDNKTLSGIPVVTESVEEINFDWGNESPHVLVPNDNFSARFTKATNFVVGSYEFSITGDDGVRLYIDGDLVLNKWIDQAPTTHKITKSLTQGEHTIILEYFESGGGAVSKLSFIKVADTPTPTNSYVAEYFNNKNLLPQAVLTRNDASIDFDWGGGSPDPLIDANNFSVRWTKSESFTSGTYEFEVTADDGVRLFVDGDLVIDQWIDQPPTKSTITKTLNSGDHTIVMEYYENGGGAVAKMKYTNVTPSPTPTPVDGYQAKYWNLPMDNSAPVIPVVGADVQSTVSVIDFNWNVLSPDPLIQQDRFVAQWTKTHTFEDGTYRFTTISDDGIRVYIDNQLVINEWNDHGSTTHIGDKVLVGGQHEIKVEYYESFGEAIVKFSFEKIPSPSPAESFTEEYFNNITLSGAPILTRQSVNINYNWGTGSPDPVVLANQFSARFTKQKNFTAGSYSFTLSSDDGVRFWIDDQLVVDDWADHALTIYTPSIVLTEGMHTLRVEYYENYDGATITLLD